MLREFGTDYLVQRGIPADYGACAGIEETSPEPEIVRARLKWKSTDEQILEAFSKVESLLWFPVSNGNGEVFYNARINGVYVDPSDHKARRFLYTKGALHTPWIPELTRETAGDPSSSLIIIEGLFKALSVLHAGGRPIGVIGTYMNEPIGAERNQNNNRVLNHTIAKFKLKTRPAYLAFDTDQFINPDVRLAVILDAIMLRVAGAVPFQLRWPGGYKGLDDYFGKEVGLDPEKQTQARERLVNEAKPFCTRLSFSTREAIKNYLNKD
jgi:hypothetical protein